MVTICSCGSMKFVLTSREKGDESQNTIRMTRLHASFCPMRNPVPETCSCISSIVKTKETLEDCLLFPRSD